MSASSYLASPRFTEDDLIREEATLSEEEKKKAEDDLYGRNTGPIETKEFIDEGIQRLQHELDNIPDDVKGSYLEAKRQRAEFTENRDDLILFLRSTGFDEKAAARRMINYWDRRIKIFGPEKAFLPLSTRTLYGDKDDMYALSMNAIHTLPKKDMFGRSILFYYPGRTKLDCKEDSMIRVVWCALHEALKDRKSSKCGSMIAVIMLRSADFELFNRKLQDKTITSMREYIPMRLLATHWCHAPRVFEYVFPVIMQLMGRNGRQRNKVFSGTDEQVLTELAKYGIPRDVLPTEMGGREVLKIQQK